MCTFHFEEFALYGANRSLFQTSVETPKSLFLIPSSEERKYFAKSFRNLSAIGDTVGRWSLSGKITEKEVLKNINSKRISFEGKRGLSVEALPCSISRKIEVQVLFQLRCAPIIIILLHILYY